MIAAAPARVSVPLEILFSSQWLASSGGTGAGDLDELCQRDDDGLPLLPMSSLKGVLREAAQRLEAAGSPDWPPGTTAALFGATSADPAVTTEGLLMFTGQARLAAAERAAFAGQPAAREALYGRRAATAIDPATGVAMARTLRTVEVVAPLRLCGLVRLRPGLAAPEGWRERLNEAAAWTLAVGKGKADGLGRVDITVGVPVFEAVAESAAVESQQLILLLEQTEMAAFSARSATEGAHLTRSWVPGSVLLGWAARSYDEFNDKLGVFHSRKVRFGDARPVAEDGSLLWPMPRVVVEPKHARGGIDRAGRLTEAALVARPRSVAGQDRPPQYEPVGPALVTGAGLTASPHTRLSTRTAMHDGRPLAGQLFGYTSLSASPDRPRRYVAVIERGSLSAEDWRRLQRSFPRGGELLLGRAAGAGQGGAFRVDVLPDQDLWPAPPREAPAPGRLVVWALSDLALVDAFGEPELSPDPAAFSLGEGRLLEGESAIATRRYAAWNAHLGCRDVEQVVIEAGSVLVFDIEKPCKDWPTAAGLHQGQGLGRIWIQPPLLEGLANGRRGPVCTSAEPMMQVNGVPASRESATAATPLFEWASARASSRRSGDDLLERFRGWRDELARFYSAPEAGEGPRQSQWRNVANQALEAATLENLLSRLFEGQNPACGRADQPARAQDWGKQGLPDPATIRDWLRSALGEVDLATARALLKTVAECADEIASESRAVDR